MPTIVKEQVDSKPAPTTKSNTLTVAALVLATAVAGALLTSLFPLPAEVPAVDIVPATDLSFFGP